MTTQGRKRFFQQPAKDPEYQFPSSPTIPDSGPPLYATLAESAPPKALGTVFGLSNSIAFLGAILAPVLIGMLKDWTNSFIGGFYVGAGAMMGAALVALAIPGRKNAKEPIDQP